MWRIIPPLCLTFSMVTRILEAVRICHRRLYRGTLLLKDEKFFNLLFKGSVFGEKKKLQCFLVRNKEPIDVTLASEIKIYPYICKPIFFLYFFHIPGKNAVLIVFLAYQLGHLPIPTQLTSSPLSYDSYKPGYFHKDMCITRQSDPLREKHYLSSYTSS